MLKKKNKKELNALNNENNESALTSTEKEALGAARNAEMREKDRKLMEDKEKEKKREEKNKKLRNYLKIAAVVLFILLLCVRCGVDLIDPDVPTHIGMDFSGDTVDEIDKIDQNEDYDSAESLMTISMNRTISFDNGLAEGQMLIENDKGNVYYQFVEIYLDYATDITLVDANENPILKADGTPEVRTVWQPNQDQRVYKSNLIDIGKTLQWDTLDVNLPKGIYKATAVFYAVSDVLDEEGNITYDSETGQRQFNISGLARAKIELYIVDSVGDPAPIEILRVQATETVE